MKIGITTFQWADNYGAVLQAYALQQFLTQRGHRVEIVNYWRGRSIRRWLRFAQYLPECFFRSGFQFLSLLRKLLPLSLKQKVDAKYKNLVFANFRRDRLCLTEPFADKADLVRFADEFDLLITGSDQVWNPRYLAQTEGMADCYFLSFARGETRKVSYAASIGHADSSLMTKKWTSLLADRLRTMDAISVREKSSVPLVEELSGRTDAVAVADPTLLLRAQGYKAIMSGQKIRKRYLFSYMLHGLEKDAASQIKEISDGLGLKAVQCDAGRSKLFAGYMLPAPTEWLSLICHASFMVTNSFHGVMFCLIFNVPFVAILINGKEGSMNARILDVLSIAGLSHRVFALGEEISEGLYRGQIEWDRVNALMEEFRGSSVRFLQDQNI